MSDYTVRRRKKFAMLLWEIASDFYVFRGGEFQSEVRGGWGNTGQIGVF